MKNLNETELAILKLIAHTSINDDGDMSTFKDVMAIAGFRFNKNQVKGYLSSLQKKGYISCEGTKNEDAVPNIIYCGRNAERMTDYL